VAVSRSFGQFARRMAIRAKQVTHGSERVVKQAAIAADTALVTSTPLDTGRAKGNWNASIGNPDTSTTETTDPSGQATMARNETEINAWRLGRGEIFLANGLPYIVSLDEGSSSQAAQGMTQDAIAAARRIIQGAKVLG
jgi:hypothetical protein